MSAAVVILLIIIIVPVVLGGLYFMGLPPFDKTERALRLKIEDRDVDKKTLRKYIEKEIIDGDLGDTITLEQAKRLESKLDLSVSDVLYVFKVLNIFAIDYKCTPTDEQKVTNGDKYVYDTVGSCVVSECVSGYAVEDGVCNPIVEDDTDAVADADTGADADAVADADADTGADADAVADADTDAVADADTGADADAVADAEDTTPPPEPTVETALTGGGIEGGVVSYLPL